MSSVNHDDSVANARHVGGMATSRFAIPRQDSHRRFRLAGDPAHRPARARGEGLLRDRAVPEGGSGVPRDETERRHSLRRAGVRARQGGAARADGDLSGRGAGARHLLRRAGHGAAARRQGRGRPSPRIRPRRGRGDDAVRRSRRRVGGRPALSGVDEPRRPRHQAAGRFRGHWNLGQCADRHDCG